MKKRWGQTGRLGLRYVSPAMPPNGRDDSPDDHHDWRDAMSQVTFSFVVVLIMAAELFVSVGLNPKNDSYGKLPWVYAATCVTGSATCWVISNRLASNHS